MKWRKGLGRGNNTFAGSGLTAKNPRNANSQLTNTALTGTPLLFVLSKRILNLLAHPVAGHTFLILARACNSLLEIYNPFTPVENAEKIKKALKKCGQPIKPFLTHEIMTGEFCPRRMEDMEESWRLKSLYGTLRPTVKTTRV
jgi:hypothetical protein